MNDKDPSGKGGGRPIDLALMEAEQPGPATPTAFREQCYLNRERLEKKRARKSGSSRLSGGGGGSDLPNIDRMELTND